MVVMMLASVLFTLHAPDPPHSNIAPNPNFNVICKQIGSDNPGCLAATAMAIDHTRKKEGIGPLYLPMDWNALTGAEQLFVITDIERVSRDEQPIPGLVMQLNAAALRGTEGSTDPRLEGGTISSIWSRSEGPLASDYDWMYFDG